MHLYFHIPFCARRCSYCDFAIAVRRVVPSAAYLEAVLREWDLRQEHPAWASGEVRTIYFGGGTPSRVEPGAVAAVLERVARNRSVSADAEITLEANPEDVTPPIARAWRAAGVNRVSLGVQSFDPAVLRWMHRTHGPGEVPAAVQALGGAGIENLSLDLIFGLPAALGRRWEDDLTAALALRPTHLSLYGLTVEPGTPLGRWTVRGEVVPVDDGRYAEEFLAADRTLGPEGFEHYEVSSYGLPGYRARHNSAYWRRAAFLGLGPSAHSGWDAERQWNEREWVAYQAAVQGGRDPVAGHERLDAEAVELEELYLGLRTVEGVPAGTVEELVRGRWRSHGWASETDGRLRLTPEGWLRLDALAASIGSPARAGPALPADPVSS